MLFKNEDITTFYESFFSAVDELKEWKSHMMTLDCTFNIISKCDIFMDRSEAPKISSKVLFVHHLQLFLGAGPSEKKIGLRDLFVVKTKVSSSNYFIEKKAKHYPNWKTNKVHIWIQYFCKRVQKTSYRVKPMLPNSWS